MPKWGKMVPYLVIETHTLLGGTCNYVSGVYGSTPPGVIRLSWNFPGLLKVYTLSRKSGQHELHEMIALLVAD